MKPPIRAEYVIAAVLLTFTGGMHFAMGDSVVAMLLDAAMFAAIALSLPLPRVASGLTWVLLGALVSLPTDVRTLGEYATIAIVFALAARGWTTLALWSSTAYLALFAVDSIRVFEGAHAIGATLMWATLLTIGFLPGWFISRARTGQTRRHQTELDEMRTGVARELHDGVASALSRIALRLQVAEVTGAATFDDLAFIGNEASRAHWQLRQLVHLLRASTVRFEESAHSGTDGGAAIVEECTFRLQQYGFSPTAAVEGTADRWPAAVGSVIRAVANEAVNNIVRHGDPALPCRIVLRETRAAASITFSNGRSHPRTEGDQLGILGIRERLHTIGAILEVEPSDELWVLRITFATGVPWSSAESKEEAR